jgi:hypothetical protein
MHEPLDLACRRLDAAGKKGDSDGAIPSFLFFALILERSLALRELDCA